MKLFDRYKAYVYSHHFFCSQCGRRTCGIIPYLLNRFYFLVLPRIFTNYRWQAD